MHPRLQAHAAAQSGLFTTRQAREAGYDGTQIRARIHAGAWVRLRRGVLTTDQVYVAANRDARAAHLLSAAAALMVTANAPCLSHMSAALLHRLPMVGAFPTDVALTMNRQHRRSAPGLELHTARLPAHHRSVVDGVPVTSVARTVSDVARSRPFTEAVVVADAALQRRLCSLADLDAVIRDCPVWPGIARTKRVAEFADMRAESPGESLSRVGLAAAGLPAPDLQVALLLAGRRLRVDFMWPKYGLVGEFDGRVKYEKADDLWDEKRREDLIRRHGHRVVRWVWSDVYPDPAPMVRLVRSALVV